MDHIDPTGQEALVEYLLTLARVIPRIPINPRPLCPLYAKIRNNMPLPLSGIFPAYRTGWGGVTTIDVGPPGFNWDNTLINEVVTPAGGSCPNAIKQGACAGLGNFVVGQAGSLINQQTLPAQHNAFYDQHVKTAPLSQPVHYKNGTIPYRAPAGPDSNTVAHYLGTQAGFNPTAPPKTTGCGRDSSLQ